jgi:sugar (pentulose or hexulose) kinase
MVLSTRASIADVYIVVLDVAADTVRALLFDSEARRVEGYSAQLPKRADAAADCLDEMHRLVHAAGFRVAAVVGRAEDEVWPAFEGAKWFAALPAGASAILGSGCVSRERFGLTIGEASLMGTIIDRPLSVDGLTCIQIDEKRWLLSGAVPEAGGAYAALKRELKARGTIEGYLETAAAGDPHLAPLDAIAQTFREIYERLSGAVGAPVETIASGAVLMKSPAWTQRIAKALGSPMILCTEPEPAGRGSAMWALEKIGALRTEAEAPAAS